MSSLKQFNLFNLFCCPVFYICFYSSYFSQNISIYVLNSSNFFFFSLPHVTVSETPVSGIYIRTPEVEPPSEPLPKLLQNSFLFLFPNSDIEPLKNLRRLRIRDGYCTIRNKYIYKISISD